MIAVTLSFYGEWKTKIQIEAEIDFGVYNPDENLQIHQIDKNNPHWNTFVFRDIDEANSFIDGCKKLKSFSRVIQIRNMDQL